MALSSQIESAARGDTAAAGPSPIPASHFLLAMPAGEPTAQAIERREAAKAITSRVLRHPCELDPKAGVRACTHPGHATDTAAARECLQALGLVDTPGRRQRCSARVSVNHRVSGRCPICRKRQHIRVDGTVGRHRHCAGEGMRPLPEEEP